MKITMKYLNIYIIVIVLSLVSCEREEVVVETCQDLRRPFIIETTENSCFRVDQLNYNEYIFRDEDEVIIDLENDGLEDLKIVLDDNSFGIANPGSSNLLIVPLSGSIHISFYEDYNESCTRYNIVNFSDSLSSLGRIDERECNLYTNEELTEVDTVIVENHQKLMAKSFTIDEEISLSPNWINDTVYIASRPYLNGEFFTTPADEYRFIGLKKEGDQNTKYGWIKIRLLSSGGVGVDIPEYGFEL